MNASRFLFCAGIAFAMVGGADRAAAVEHGIFEWVARLASPEFRRIEARQAVLDREIDGLPALMGEPLAWRYGFRSATMMDPEIPQWLQIDLGGMRMIDRLVAVPAHIPPLGDDGVGYGFPRRFMIEVSDDPEMQDAVLVVDERDVDFANPGRYPADFRIDPVAGRYVRFTSTRHFAIDEGFIWALEELMVLSGNQSVSTWRDVTTSSSLEMFPNWSSHRSQDGQSALGIPVAAEASLTRGYLSAPADDPDELKWLHVDLGDAYPIDEIRLVPVQSESFETLDQGLFPRSWAVELAVDSAFEEIIWRLERAPTNLIGYPGDCAVIIPSDGARGRHLRFLALKHWGAENQIGYGLAEIQAYSGDTNVALGKPVVASDATISPGWSPAYVTNGFGSRHRLIEIPEHLDLIGRRAVFDGEREILLEARARHLRVTGQILIYGGSSFGGVAIVSFVWLLVRQRSIRRRTVAQLREQIARDLHDDIGSNLGGIVLLSEMGQRQSHDPQSREDFRTIMEAADGTAQSMQDIVWLIEHGHASLHELIVRMRRSTEMLLGDLAQISVTPEEIPNRKVSLFFRRHFFFAFKEAINNVRRHAGAGEVQVRIAIVAGELSFEVADDGVGCDLADTSMVGHGLTNLRRRAERLRGTCKIESQPGQGMRVIFKARMQTNRP